MLDVGEEDRNRKEDDEKGKEAAAGGRLGFVLLRWPDEFFRCVG